MVTGTDSIEILDIPTRTLNGLLRKGIMTIGDLIKLEKSDLVKLKGIGLTSVGCVVRELARFGFQMGQAQDAEHITITKSSDQATIDRLEEELTRVYVSLIREREVVDTLINIIKTLNK